MGMDVHGLNPIIRRETSNVEVRDLLEQDWTKLSEDDLGKYFEAKQQYEEDNPGIYFRNNVWWWRPLWHFVSFACENILTDKDVEQGSWNDGHIISKTKANRIAKRLHRLIKDGKVKEYEDEYKKELESLEQLDCDLCEATGRRNEPPQTGAGDYMECNGCDGTGKTDDWARSYPFS